MSLILPWEVMERIIDHASNDIDLLRTFSLTCRQLRHRSFTLIVAQYIFLDSKERVSDFSDFIRERNELQPLIQSLIISPADFRSFPLVNILPRLSGLGFITPGCEGYHGSWERPSIELHSTILTCYHSFGKRIRALSFDHLSFQTPSDLFRLVLAFPKATQISCHDIVIKSPGRNSSAVEVLKGKLLKQLQLKTLKV